MKSMGKLFAGIYNGCHERCNEHFSTKASLEFWIISAKSEVIEKKNETLLGIVFVSDSGSFTKGLVFWFFLDFCREQSHFPILLN